MPDARVDRTNTERMVCNSQVRTETATETDTETTATDTESTHSTTKQNETLLTNVKKRFVFCFYY